MVLFSFNKSKIYDAADIFIILNGKKLKKFVPFFYFNVIYIIDLKEFKLMSNLLSKLQILIITKEIYIKIIDLNKYQYENNITWDEEKFRVNMDILL